MLADNYFDIVTGGMRIECLYFQPLYIILHCLVNASVFSDKFQKVISQRYDHLSIVTQAMVLHIRKVGNNHQIEANI